MSQNGRTEETTLVLISKPLFPSKSRHYLLDLVRDVAIKHKAGAVGILGGSVDGEYLQKELNVLLKFAKAELKKRGIKLNSEEALKYLAQVEDRFVASIARDLSHALRRIPGINYHIGIAEKVYDKPIGVRVLKALRDMRKDVRLIGELEDGTYDPEPKFPLKLKNFPLARWIMPRHAPWYYRIISSFMQTLINRFAPRTFSDAPNLILVGGTGTQAYLPYYEGVPSFSIPDLQKIDDMKSTEHMVGCLVLRIVCEGNQLPRIISRHYDFRPVVSRERELLTPKDASDKEKLILRHFRQYSSTSPNHLLFRLNAEHKGKVKFTGPELREILRKLVEQKLIFYRKRSNRYAVNESQLSEIQVKLDDLLADTRTVRLASRSCVHTGALKALYRTMTYRFPARAVDCDAIVENGDLIQGLAHLYEYNGELLPIANGFDKQEIIHTALTARNLLDIFRMRLAKIADPISLPVKELVLWCLPKYFFEKGNHPAWVYHSKMALPLYWFEESLKWRVTRGILAILAERGISASFFEVEEIVSERVARVGERSVVVFNGIAIGVKHPSKPRTLSKSHRIQDVHNFLHQTLNDRAFLHYLKNVPVRVAVLLVANFHEAGAVHLTKFGRTTFGVMTASNVKDTSFETSRDKAVEHGFALTTVALDKEDRLVYTEVEYDDFIHPDDAKFVFADKIETSAVNELCAWITKELVDLPWRY